MSVPGGTNTLWLMVIKHDSTHILGKIISTFCSFTGSPTQTHTYWSCNISLRTKSIHSQHVMYISYSVVALTYGITNSSVWGSQTPSVQAQRLGFSSFHSWQVQRDSAVTPTASIKQTLAQLPCLVKEIAWEVKRALLVAGLLEAVLNLCDAAAVFQGQSDNLQELVWYTNMEVSWNRGTPNSVYFRIFKHKHHKPCSHWSNPHELGDHPCGGALVDPLGGQLLT